MVRRYLIALDGKNHSQYAFDWYLDNLNSAGDEVIIFHCSMFQLSILLPGAVVNADAVGKQVKDAQVKAEAITAQAAETLKHRGIKGYVVLKSGMKPEDAILEVCQEHSVTHIVMGTRSLGTVQRALIGSVSTAVARNAKVPVTIVKPEH